MTAFSLRPVTAPDTPFLRELFRSVRESMFRALGLSDAQIAAICEQQFGAQAAGYAAAYPQASYLVIERGRGVPVGRVTIARTHEALVLVDIALLAAHRNRGIGSAVIRGLQDEAASQGVPLALTVEAHSPARDLYRRLGFEAISEQDLRCRMRWRREQQHQPGESAWTHTSAK